ncbi:16S rRNA (cytosine(1402)-N(4))-methyltransferase RsmH [Flavilitoribacter nigricans]|uniref:Ribosomal RNA small subunit methyltransferase H n=1 Tax=Flavilitoribacter nigricans (strain ATCC 23147 / DSM 23189 / NBRC 102662 / NCIMB 1420 / SS-2) TaxID=1122177 RepID=A0A2D0NA19_FLAN2|nr:16S rRNA (cytosine(1402)-N(4))-methyltransferase RsmH [Flavilitoribacter nigricans]PHN05228.1 16S rRNA (cytosine(1402)-N(4))-methyltransferase [Flavilitoribacter nigricans DSM 23189 = NBRC 102662]
MTYHVPVMPKESIEGLAIAEAGVFVDATFGGGGHSRLILEALGDKGRLLGFDQDQDALGNVPEDERFTFVQHNFRFLRRFLKLYGIRQVDGILADLGVSSHQLDEGSRGFSYRFDHDLDMRMNQNDGSTAADVLNTYLEEDLVRIFSEYGEVRNSKTLAAGIVQARQGKSIRSVDDFLSAMDPFVRGTRWKYLSQVFQALRIEVNDEMAALEEFLEQSLEVLKPGGRLVVISYHSLEDRLVKNFLRSGNLKGEQEKDFYGNIYRPFKVITKKALLPRPEEIEVNPRARSAKLRVGEKKSEE